MAGNHKEDKIHEIINRGERKDDEIAEATWDHLWKSAYDEYTRFFALSIWEWAGRPWGMSLDFWLAGEKFVRAWNEALPKIGWWPPTGSDGLLNMKEIVPIESYLNFVELLAREMSDHADRQYRSAQKAFWVAAEETALAIMNAAVTATKSADEIRIALIKEFEQFSPEIYLKYLREAAYFISQERKGSEEGDALGDWLKAEDQAKEKLKIGERIAKHDTGNNPVVGPEAKK